MFRHTDGTLLSLDEHDEFTREIGRLFYEPKFLQRVKFKQEDYEVIAKFMYLLKNDEPENKHNEITKIFKKITDRKYKLQEDEETKKLTKFQKILRTITRKKYIAVQLGNAEKKHYNHRAIFHKIAHNLQNIYPTNIPENLSEKQKEDAFIKLVKKLETKYKSTVVKEMTNIRVAHTKFTKTRHVMAFKERFSHPIFRDQIDFDRLLKYLAATSKIKSTKDDIKWLEGLIRIILRKGIVARKEDDEAAEYNRVLAELLDQDTKQMLKDIENDIELSEEVMIRHLDLDKI